MAADLALFPRTRSGKVRPCPHCQRRHRQVRMAVLAVLAALVLAAGIIAALTMRPSADNGPVQQAQVTSYTGPGNRILDEAETKVNHYYAWGGTGPAYFDCSGLLYWAAGAAGERNWPRDTFDIAREIGSRFSITSHPQRGDLAMWGSYAYPYHVELVTIWSQTTFGAETYGWNGRVTWHYDGWFRPSYYLHINW